MKSHGHGATAFVACVLILWAAGCRPDPTSRAERDRAALRDLAVGLESYAVDWGCYPDRLENLTVHIECIGKSKDGLSQGKIVGPWVDAIPASAYDPALTPQYAALRKPGNGLPNYWIAAFPGPDGDWDTGECGGWQGKYASLAADDQCPAEFTVKCYDPTNGEISDGDIVCMKQ